MKKIFFLSILSTGIFSTNVFSQYGKIPCGMTGNIKERIIDCSRYPSNKLTNSSYVLVSRSTLYREVYLNTEDRQLLSDKVPGRHYYSDAVKACSTQLPEFSGIRAYWRLPRTSDYYRAHDLGMMSIPNMGLRSFWTSEVSGDLAYVYNTLNGSIGMAYKNRYPGANVRCVADFAYVE